MAVRKILMLKKEGKIWTFLLENDVIAEIHCSLPEIPGSVLPGSFPVLFGIRTKKN